MSPPDQRTRTVHWTDPLASMTQMAGMTGLDVVLAALRGEIAAPPMAELLGMRGVEAEEGRAVVAVEPAEYHANQAGAAHGGLAAALLDGAMWTALHTTMPAGAYCTTLQMSISYLRAIPVGGGEVRAEGRVLHRGRRTAGAEGSVRDSAGKLCAHATTTCLIIEP